MAQVRVCEGVLYFFIERFTTFHNFNAKLRSQDNRGLGFIIQMIEGLFREYLRTCASMKIVMDDSPGCHFFYCV